MLNRFTSALRAAPVVLLLLQAAAAGADCTRGADPGMPGAEAMQSALREARDHGYLWRVRKDGRTSWLYGTIHVGRLDSMFPGPTVAQSLHGVDVLALELDPLDPDVQARLAQAIAAMPHAPIPQALERRLRAQAEALCVAYDTIAAYAPELQAVALATLAGRAEHLDTRFSADLGLALVAHEDALPVISLETPELQVQTLRARDAREAVALVEDGLDELEPGRSAALLGRMARAWLDSDYGEMAHYADWCQCLDTPVAREFMRRMLDERNPALARTIDELMRSGKSVFAATGSLHMFGAGGLPALLQARGYRVERLELHQ